MTHTNHTTADHLRSLAVSLRNRVRSHHIDRAWLDASVSGLDRHNHAAAFPTTSIR